MGHEGNESVSPGSSEEPVTNQGTSISTVSTEDSNSPSPTEALIKSKRNSVSTEDSLRNKRSPSSTKEAVRYKRSPVLSTEDTNRKKRSSSDEHGDEPHPHQSTEEPARRKRNSFSTEDSFQKK